jgi:hypothetical protein
MTALSKEDADFLHKMLSSDDDDDPIFGKRGGRPPPFVSPQVPAARPSVNPPRSPSAGSAIKGSPPITRPGAGAVKCVQVFIGGTDLTEGRTADVSDPHSCSNMFCISCDHRVIRFPDRKWRDGTDYMFLRNNYPNAVAPNLMHAPRWAAYCCQCTFCSEQATRKVPAFSTNWVCLGHE